MATTVAVYPREGTTYPDAAGVAITADGAIVDVSKYIRDAIGAGFLLTFDPLGNYQPDDRSGTGGGGSGSGGRSFASQSLLAAAIGAFSGEVVSTTGCISAGDGGGGSWFWDSGSSDPSDVGLVSGAGPSGRWKRIYSDTVDVTWFGARGGLDVAYDDYVPLAAAFATGKTVVLPGPYYYTSQPLRVAASCRIIGKGVFGTTIGALSAMTHIALFEINASAENIIFDGNALALDGVTFDQVGGGGGCRFDNCQVQTTKRHGWYGGTLGLTSNVSFYHCFAKSCGTRVTGSVQLTAGSRNIVFTSPIDLSVIENDDAYLVISGEPASPIIINSFSDSTHAQVVINNITQTGTKTFTLYSGNGWDITKNSDNGLWGLYDCHAQNCGKAGVDVKSLYGAMLSNFTAEACGVGMKVGLRGDFGSSPNKTILTKGYFEGSWTRDIVCERSSGFVILDPLLSSGNALWCPDFTGYLNVYVLVNGEPCLFTLELINQTTPVDISGLRRVQFRQGSGFSDVTLRLPLAGVDHDAGGNSVFYQQYEIWSSDLGGHNINVITTSAAVKVNGVAGTTGITLSGNYKKWTATWSRDMNGWVVA